MKLVYVGEEYPPLIKETPLFLMGPTPRKSDIPSWRPDALRILKRLAFEGVVIIPEDRRGSRRPDYTEQVWWEQCGLMAARDYGCIVAWVPRGPDMEGFTTNVEFGMYVNNRRSSYGRPNTATRVRYLDVLYQGRLRRREPATTLEETLENAVTIANETRYEW